MKLFFSLNRLSSKKGRLSLIPGALALSFSLVVLAPSAAQDALFADSGSGGLARFSAQGASPAPKSSGFDFSLVWTGAWENSFPAESFTEGTDPLFLVSDARFTNRLSLKLGLPWQGLNLRSEVLDRRNTDFSDFPPWEDAGPFFPAFSGGLYHKPSGSRIVYGILDEWGLPARIRNPWIRSVPFPEYHTPQAVDLKTTASERESDAGLYLSSPQMGPIQVFALSLMDAHSNLSLGGGLNWRFDRTVNLSLESFYTGKKLAAKTVSTWFADSPPLPARDFSLYSLAFAFSSPLFIITADGAFSDTFAFGRDFYTDIGLRFGDKPWRFSLAADAAGPRFTGRDGSTPGAAFRSAAKLEWRGKRNSLFRMQTNLRAPSLDQPFNRSSSILYYRFPASTSKKSGGTGKDKTAAYRFPIKVSRISFEADRNASDPTQILDSFDVFTGFSIGSFRPTLSASLDLISSEESLPPDSIISPYPLPFQARFDSAGIAGELLYAYHAFQYRVNLSYTLADGSPHIWGASFYTSVKGALGRFSLKIATPKFPERWSYTLSWRLEV
ncbi:MAG: hypothetical protein LBQ88_22170 [Treponema sp.]|jgi:hypothetical protein|nr:hypothetical protein [Treponema sp.]